MLSEPRRIVRSPSLLANWAVASAAGAGVLLASLVNLLNYNSYSLAAPEVLWVSGGIVWLALAGGAIYLLAPNPVRAVIDALLVFLAIDLNFDSTLFAVAAGVATLALALWRRRPLAPVIAFMAGVVLLLNLGTAMMSRPKPVPAVTRGAHPEQPALLHVILDEHIGIEGLPADNPQTPAVRKMLLERYVSEGFRLYGRAYSEHFHTANAVPQIVNFGETQSQTAGPMEKGVKVPTNRYFDYLRGRGYAINVYQNDWIDFCDGRKVRCASYTSGGLEGVKPAALSTVDKAELIALNLMALSPLGRAAPRHYDRAVMKLREAGLPAPPLIGAGARATAGLNTLAMTRTLMADLRQAHGGEAYVAHLLLPHYPYITDPDCKVRPHAQWNYGKHEPVMRHGEAGYFDQIACATSLVENAVRALENSPSRNNFIVVVHGDHGSRMTTQDPRLGRTVSDRDMIASYSTLFAVRAPGIAPGYDPRPAAVPALLKGLVQSDFTRAPVPAGRGIVFLEDDDRNPSSRVVLPAAWLGLDQSPSTFRQFRSSNAETRTED
ncbi:MAG TPA: hypothetical protein VFX95_03180 [Caulobacteraceae bacterium]|nr:hypothetical protein [Caulobacteraceae bacterium]